MDYNVVGRVQWLPLPLVGKNRDCSTVLVPDDTARRMLASDLPSLVVKRVAVAVPGRRAESADMPTFLIDSYKGNFSGCGCYFADRFLTV